MPDLLHWKYPTFSRGGRGHWTINYTNAQVYYPIILFVSSKTLGAFNKFWFVDPKLYWGCISNDPEKLKGQTKFFFSSNGFYYKTAWIFTLHLIKILQLIKFCIFVSFLFFWLLWQQLKVSIFKILLSSVTISLSLKTHYY